MIEKDVTGEKVTCRISSGKGKYKWLTVGTKYIVLEDLQTSFKILNDGFIVDYYKKKNFENYSQKNTLKPSK